MNNKYTVRFPIRFWRLCLKLWSHKKVLPGGHANKFERDDLEEYCLHLLGFLNHSLAGVVNGEQNTSFTIHKLSGSHKNVQCHPSWILFLLLWGKLEDSHSLLLSVSFHIIFVVYNQRNYPCFFAICNLISQSINMKVSLDISVLLCFYSEIGTFLLKLKHALATDPRVVIQVDHQHQLAGTCLKCNCLRQAPKYIRSNIKVIRILN